MQLASLIDHTLLKADATRTQIQRLCEEARTHLFASVCVNPHYVTEATELLKGSTVKVCTVVGFPLGCVPTNTKAFETATALQQGATEIDMVMNIAAAKSGEWNVVEADIKALADLCRPNQALLKVIIEACLLTDAEKVRACECAVRAGADFVKTSTGFSTGGATVADVALMRKAVGPNLGVKASGGIKDRATAEAMIAAGATRLGTSSGVQLVNSGTGAANY